MAESNKMKDMPVNKLMVQMGIPMILSMLLIFDKAFMSLSVNPRFETISISKTLFLS